MKIFYISLSIVFITFQNIVIAGEMTISHQGSVSLETFDGFDGTFSSLPDGFSISKDGVSTMLDGDNDFRGIKSAPITTGGCYAWDLGNGNHTLGFQPTEDDFTPGWMMLSVSNACKNTISEITLAYEIVCRNNANRSSVITFEYACVNNSISSRSETVEDFFFASPETAQDTTSWTTNIFFAKIKLEKTLAVEGVLRCTWRTDDYNGSGSRDELGINNLSITFHKPRGTAIAIR